MNVRRNGSQPSHPIPVWNGIFEHRKQIGSALWVFLWCIDGVTQERDGVGLVHGGAPVKIPAIAAALSLHAVSVRRSLRELVKGAYIRCVRTPYGLRIEVLNSLKFGIWQSRQRSSENARTDAERSSKSVREIEHFCSERSSENARNKEDSANNTAINTTTGPQNARPVQPPCGKVKNEGQKQYAEVRDLAAAGERLLRLGEVRTIPDLKEDLKRIAAMRDFSHYGPKVDHAAGIAMARFEGRPAFQRESWKPAEPNCTDAHEKI